MSTDNWLLSTDIRLLSADIRLLSAGLSRDPVARRQNEAAFAPAELEQAARSTQCVAWTPGGDPGGW
jgi:hypothetical protein